MLSLKSDKGKKKKFEYIVKIYNYNELNYLNYYEMCKLKIVNSKDHGNLINLKYKLYE